MSYMVAPFTNTRRAGAAGAPLFALLALKVVIFTAATSPDRSPAPAPPPPPPPPSSSSYALRWRLCTPTVLMRNLVKVVN